MARLAHLTSVHSVGDPRIARKECASLAAAGHDVVLVAADPDGTPPAGVRVVRVPRAPARLGRLARVTLTAGRVIAAGLRQRADAYHVHDPELLPWAALLRLAGRRVVYDVHEDYVTALRQKHYLPGRLTGLLATAWDRVERVLAAPLAVVLAERYYRDRFPAGHLVLNYPVLPHRPPPPAYDAASRRLLYTGNVTVDRGALHHAALAERGYEVHLVGQCSPALAERLREVAGGHAGRLHLPGVGRYVPYDEIAAAYATGGWLAGLALFPRTAHYERKELTKFFEYFAAGLPVVCSDPPAWRRLVADAGAGLCVDPDDPDAAVAALDALAGDPAAGAAMAARGQQLAWERYSWQSQVPGLLETYDELLA